MAKKRTPIDNPGAALVRKRWDRTTPEERTANARRMLKARWGKRKKGKGSKTEPKEAR